MKKAVVIALTLGLTSLAITPTPALAQVAAAQVAAAQATPAQPREVAPRDLMTLSERFDMWRKMRAARTPEERVALWTQKRVELAQRAREKGVVLREPGPMMMGGAGHDRAHSWSGDHAMHRMGPPTPPISR